jgi:pimeloyl-ACP methyl ester carboxylesterase
VVDPAARSSAGVTGRETMWTMSGSGEEGIMYRPAPAGLGEDLGGPARPCEASTVSSRLRVLRGGAGRPLLLLLHGLGATAHVWEGWRPLLDERWPGRWVAADLPGHGGSAPLPRYSFGSLAAAVADLVVAGDRTVVVGHSLGGVVGLALGSGWFGVPVQAVLGACRARVILAREETDPMVSADDVTALLPDAVTLPGLGHNAHVENPAAVLSLLEPLVGPQSPAP